MDVNIIGVPIFYGADKKGPENAPKILRDKNISSIIKKYNHKVYDLGNLDVPVVEDEKKYSFHSKMKYLNPIVEVNTNLAHAVYQSLKASNFPLIIGGDHSLGLGSISGFSKMYNNFAVIWLDAHGDINTHNTTSSGNVHGMPLAAAMGIGSMELTDVYFKGIKVKPKNVFILGARDIDEGEEILIRNRSLNVYSPSQIREKGIKALVEEILHKLEQENIQAVHLSFDMDFIDSQFVPGTGTPVGDGFNIQETEELLKELVLSKKIKSMDFVELNNLLDRDETTIEIALDIIDNVFKYI